MIDIPAGIQQVQTRIKQAANEAERAASAITLVAVSKTKPVEAIVAAYDAGQRHFGENRAEELEQKAEALKHLPGIQWHFIGHLQTRQSKAIADYAHYFHAVDRLKIAERLSHQLAERERTLPVYVEVNISGEVSKGGFNCANWEQDSDQRDEFLNAVKSMMALPQLSMSGLMTMAPFNAPEDEIRSIFRRLRELSEWLNRQLSELDAHELSMGMTGDFEIAVEEGASCVRVGTAIFGER